MFFREKKRGATRLLQLVENHLNAEGKVCQRVVVSLGGCPVPDEVRKRVAAEITHRMVGYDYVVDFLFSYVHPVRYLWGCGERRNGSCFYPARCTKPS